MKRVLRKLVSVFSKFRFKDVTHPEVMPSVPNPSRVAILVYGYVLGQI